MEYETLFEKVKEGEIVAGVTSTGKRERLFISTADTLCYFPPRRRRVGYRLGVSDILRYVDFVSPHFGKKDALQQKYNMIRKYKKLAQKASFTNKFIKQCSALPDTFEAWKFDMVVDRHTGLERPKDVYDYGITTGNKIDGKVITIHRIEKAYPRIGAALRNAIANRTTERIVSGYPFAGYEMSLETRESDGEFQGWLSLKYKGCGNGYYYLLINDDAFIGYDVG